MNRVCQCRNGSYSEDCCDDYLTQGIGSLENQGNSVKTHVSTLKTRVSVRNATQI